MTKSILKLFKCPGCSIEVEDNSPAPHPYIGAHAGCWEIYGKVLAREYENKDYFKHHRFTVDAYAIQHPGAPERRAIQSVNIHLISLALIFEKGISLEKATKAMGVIIKNNNCDFKWLNPPKINYQITIIDMFKMKDATSHCNKAREWALHVWNSWSEHKKTIEKYSVLY